MRVEDKLQYLNLFKQRLEISIEHEKGNIDDSTYMQQLKHIESKLQALNKKFTKGE